MNAISCEHCGLPHRSASCPIVSPLPTVQVSRLLPRGTRVGGRFRVLAVAHQQGRSTVYRAEDVRDQGLPVAVKEFNAEDISPVERAEALGWLAREAGLLSTLAHPQVPRLVAAFSEEDRHYIVMPFLDGYTLEEMVARRGPLPEALVLGWAHSLADLLTFLHGQEPPIIHRDLKPANILVRPDGSIMLLDFGVARFVTPGKPGTAIGTPGYAPPEQYQGLADSRSDLYALGATLHRALTGYDAEHEPPFRQPPVRELNPAVNHETAALVNQLLHIAPDQRPEYAGEISTEVRRILRSVHVQPLLLMYRQILALLAIAVPLSVMLYQWTIAGFSMGLSDGPAQFFFPDNSFTASLNPNLQVLHLTTAAAMQLVLLMFSPALLCSLPLFHSRLRGLIARDATMRAYWQRAIVLLSTLWLLPVAVWAADLALLPTYGSDWVLQPGALVLSAPIALGSALIAAVFLVRQYCAARAMLHSIGRIRWYEVVLRVGGFFLLWSAILIVQQLSIHAWQPLPLR